MSLTQEVMSPAEERYRSAGGRVYLTGVQALVRVLVNQRRLDTRDGRDTAAFVSGYEGSPLAGFDLELGRQAKLLAELGIVHRPGVNEELAATAVEGSQLASLRPDVTCGGVVGLWYGKAPGLDRATDALRHANLMGTFPGGGVVAAVGDDPSAKSSTVPSASELALAELAMPTLYPADSQDVLDFGLHAVAVSRASGLWSALKLVTAVADGGCEVDVALDRFPPPAPGTPAPETGAPAPYRHEITASLLGAVPVAAEASAFGVRLETAARYAAEHGLNVIRGHGSGDRIGIVAAGPVYLAVCEALDRLGIDDAARAALGIRLLKMGMIFPVAGAQIDRFADGLTEIVVVEEKRPFLETAFKEHLYGRAGAPRIVGKRDESSAVLVRQDGELDVPAVTVALARRLAASGAAQAARWLQERETPPAQAASAQAASAQAASAQSGPAPTRRILPLAAARGPYFCSGCPHNRSTQVPDGSLVGAGIGCHAMVLMMPASQVGDVVGLTQMGGEGAQWIGMAPFVRTGHLLQNLGDGTFHHSGSLAVRAAVAAGSHVTYKLLYNSAVAMTGGQVAEGGRTVSELTHLLRAEGVARIIVTTESPRRYRRVRLAPGVRVWHRDRLEEAQRVLAATAGVTVLIHDQQCATEKRRARKRAQAGGRRTAEPRVVINERVCEGCGDCGRKSNCLSVQPVSTEYGRKTRIHQSTCNTDYSCLDGDCPSFVTVRPARRGRGGNGATNGQPAANGSSTAAGGELPEPSPVVAASDFSIRITGIGGTGVVTVAQILAAAAARDGRSVRTLDQTGLSQKGGAVVSDLRISAEPQLRANRLSQDDCDLYLGCDILVATEDRNLTVAGADRTVAVVSTSFVPTGAQVADPAAPLPDLTACQARIEEATRPAPRVFLDAHDVARRVIGSDQYANVLLLGAAFQVGAIPLSLGSIRHAITANGVAVPQNLAAFEAGRRSALPIAGPTAEPADSPAVPAAPDRAQADRAQADRAQAGRADGLLVTAASALAGTSDAALLDLVRRRAGELCDYQDERVATGYLATLDVVYRAETEAGVEGTRLTAELARQLYKLTAYKDEYEVARLSLDPEFSRMIAAEFGPGARFAWRLHPPVLRSLGLRRKIALGPWARPALVALRGARRVRGTRWDVFGHTEVRRTERQLLAEFRELAAELAVRLTPANHDLAVRIAALPDVVRGYEHVKLANIVTYREQLAGLLAEFRA
ncbi:MAG TPA: indolepyruvate ferredoxin oxidoreductase family protein [Streptosporangiaceae bacterium]